MEEPGERECCSETAELYAGNVMMRRITLFYYEHMTPTQVLTQESKFLSKMLH